MKSVEDFNIVGSKLVRLWLVLVFPSDVSGVVRPQKS
jgi:hypothetical protein